VGNEMSDAATIELRKARREEFPLRAILECYLPGIDVETGEELVNRAHKICPYSRATRDNITVTLNLLLDE